MTKKISALILAFCIILFTSCVFAANTELGDSMNKAGSNVKNAVENTGNVMKNGANAIGTGVKDLGNTVSNGVTKTTNDMTRMSTNNDGYMAEITATNGSFMGMNGTTWTWFILAIAALAIIGLVWYYAMQNSREYTNHDDSH